VFPWVFGFTWTTGNVIFLGIFYSVVVVIFTTFIIAARRTLTKIKAKHVDEIAWHSDFEDLPISAKTCRHVISGELDKRTCPNGFDCRVCDLHPKLVFANAISTKAQSGTSKNSQLMYGLNMPADRLYHRGHTWVKKEKDGTLSVGLDDFGRKVIGETEGVELPEIGSKLQVNGTGWYFKKADTKIRVLSPVEGNVIETGNGGKGFYLKVKP